MYRRNFLQAGARVLGLSVAAPFINRGRSQLFAQTAREYSTRTTDLVRTTPVVDMLGLVTLNWARLDRWHASPATFTSTDLARLRESGITAFHPAVKLNEPRPRKAAERNLRDWVSFLSARNDCFVRVNTPADIVQAHQQGKVAVVLGMQNSDHFEKPEDVRWFHGLGQRTSQLTYNGRNQLGQGCSTQPDLGLTPFGVSIVDAMNECGMAVDVSHCSEKTTLDAIEASKKPVLITHSNCRALCPHPRCKSDEVIKSMAARGSVMGITNVRSFVSRENPTLDTVLDHFDHIARIAGVEHVGIGSDTDPAGSGRQYEIAGMNRGRRIYDLTEGLVRRGYTDDDIRLMLGGNFLRVLGEIWGA
jgi:membrane dipeptidase